ncbi:hypothetical protein, conserved [Angomonas deanei]|uniref:Uncharacterized protein n=1 Tax=Angomonas deanei TaxID=59799 RepID=A0A7G2CAP6_9TRYP|nr:hypothetical protein, conserved [Angomonas deanei]
MYRDPYEEYEAQRDVSSSSSSDSTRVPSSFDDVPPSVTHSSDGATHIGDHSRQAEEVSHQSINISALSGPRHATREDGPSHHPLLTELATLIKRDASTPVAPEDKQDRAFHECILRKIDTVRAHLQHAREEAELELTHHGQEGDIWSTGHARRKAALTFLDQLEDRVEDAENLFKLQRNEQETLQQSHVRLLAECLTMRFVLGEVGEAVRTAAEHHSTSASEGQLARELQEVLESP